MLSGPEPQGSIWADPQLVKLAFLLPTKKEILHVLLKTPQIRNARPDMVVHTAVLSHESGAEGHCEFEARMLYITSSRPLMATKSDYVI